MKFSEKGLGIQRRDKPQDVFYTPTELVKAHLGECVPYYKDGDLVFDPFFGKGAYYNLYDEFFPNCRKEFTEIAMGKDFFEYKGKPDIVVSNPPFSLISSVMKRLIELRPKCISLIMGSMNMTITRLRIMDEAGYTLSSLRIEKVDHWFAETFVATWILKECSLYHSDLCRISWGVSRHKNIDGYVLPKDRKKKITSDSSTPASE
jgi:hypothetical protein